MRRLLLPLMAFLLLAAPASAAKMALFDNAHAEQAGNADWVIDDTSPIPSPAQSGITPGTAETFWNGAISAWGVALVKRGYTVHTNTAALTYGNVNNTYDLSKYDVLVLCEPNTLFSAAEKTAILNFVLNGGGLVAISDHSGSDRNSDGADSPVIFNDLDPTHLLGVHYGVSGDANNNIVQTSTNVATAATDSIIHGPMGNATGLAYHNGTTLTLYPSVNASVRGEVWMTGLAHTSNTGVMFASSVYGNGRVAFEGDSSPSDDGTGASGNNLFNGWGESGATDSTLFVNATLWVSRRTAGDTQPPTVSLTSPAGGEAWKVASSHAITWTAADNVGVTSVDLAYSTDGGASYPNTIATGLTNSGTYTWTIPNAPGTTARVRATARDAAGNAGTGASASNFTIDRWTITASAGTGGSISPSGAVSVSEGGSQAFTIAANSGYTIASVLVDGASVGAVSSYTFSNVTANHTISASFAVVGNFTITASAGTGGTITPSGAVQVASGGSQAFAIAASGGYSISSVLVDGASVGAVTSYTFSNVTANHTIAASFTAGVPSAWPMASGNYTESFADIANWANNFASGVGANVWGAVPVQSAGTIPDGAKTTVSTATFTTGTSGGVQRGSGNIVLLTTGTTDNTSADAIDLRLDYTGIQAGTLTFDWSVVFNSTGDRKGSLRVYTSPDGATFTELSAADVLNFTNNVAGSGTVSAVALPAALGNSANARVRFYYHNGTGGTTGSRPKIAIDNVAVTGGGGFAATRAGAPDDGRMPQSAATRYSLALAPAQPNPVPGADGAELAFTLPHPGPARVELLDLGGRRIWSAAGEWAAGPHAVRWNGRTADGGVARVGVYFVRLVTPWGGRTGRIVLL